MVLYSPLQGPKAASLRKKMSYSDNLKLPEWRKNLPRVLDPGLDAVTFHLPLKILWDKNLTSSFETMKLSQKGNYLLKVTNPSPLYTPSPQPVENTRCVFREATLKL
ncbi:hypothetical protein I79_016487 [Cricetulus griseus]|uniref:Uncharacterized protein n=1 Tax=Cricetulus griseus TaxID=10029 RepID=G3HZI3_CRIGR|nr:hypothetical protein I79_016487 [Cricetulus griseus]